MDRPASGPVPAGALNPLRGAGVPLMRPRWVEDRATWSLPPPDGKAIAIAETRLPKASGTCDCPLLRGLDALLLL